jgi:hypothetical protein
MRQAENGGIEVAGLKRRPLAAWGKDPGTPDAGHGEAGCRARGKGARRG